MEIYGYGEDSLTLWAIKNRLGQILGQLKDTSPPADCRVFYRPSFGRRGLSTFGEPDFVILAETCLYIGESKWDKKWKVKDGVLRLRNGQVTRNKIFRCYVRQWFAGKYNQWNEFRQNERVIVVDNVRKPIPRENTRLAKTILTILETIRPRHNELFKITDVLLYLYNGNNTEVELPREVHANGKETRFKVILIDYSGADTYGTFVRMNI